MIEELPPDPGDFLDAPSPKNLEDELGGLIAGGVSGTGEEELLRLASTFSLQYTARQMRALALLNHLACIAEDYSRPKLAREIRGFIAYYTELKKNNNSDQFVMRALDSISLRKFINENTLKVNIEK